MALPKLDKPIHEVYLKSLNKNVKFRPFLVKEEKLLLMAAEGADIKQMIDTIKQVARNCVIDSDVDIDKLPLFDIEMLFLNLRARSVGEIANIRFKCEQIVKDETTEEEKPCGFVTDIAYDVLKTEYSKKEEISNLIKLTDTVALKMKFPDLSRVSKYYNDQGDPNQDPNMIVDYIAENIEAIISGDEIFDSKTTTEDEIKAFVEELTRNQIEKITSFFTSIPKVIANIEYTCKRCNFEHKLEVEGVQNFFD
jgi:hypothetical protein